MRLPSAAVCMKNTSWSVVPFQVGEKSSPMRPPSPSVVCTFGTVPTCVFVPDGVTLNTLNVSRSVTSAYDPSGAHEMSHGTSQPLATLVGVWGTVPQLPVVNEADGVLGVES